MSLVLVRQSSYWEQLSSVLFNCLFKQLNSTTKENMTTHSAPIKIIKDKEVADKLSISRTMVWNMTKNIPTFPKPISISRRSTGWFEHEIDSYLSAIAAQRPNSQNSHFSTVNLQLRA